jgi:hypothetical protein
VHKSFIKGTRVLLLITMLSLLRNDAKNVSAGVIHHKFTVNNPAGRDKLTVETLMMAEPVVHDLVDNSYYLPVGKAAASHTCFRVF